MSHCAFLMPLEPHPIRRSSIHHRNHSDRLKSARFSSKTGKKSRRSHGSKATMATLALSVLYSRQWETDPRHGLSVSRSHRGCPAVNSSFPRTGGKFVMPNGVLNLNVTFVTWLLEMVSSDYYRLYNPLKQRQTIKKKHLNVFWCKKYIEVENEGLFLISLTFTDLYPTPFTSKI